MAEIGQSLRLRLIFRGIGMERELLHSKFRNRGILLQSELLVAKALMTIDFGCVIWRSGSAIVRRRSWEIKLSNHAAILAARYGIRIQ